ncbi:hypothetical protein FQR65_LT15840 [Abscondita terminalis]|nr:hypothetical protein FQR65_LT15840 [Abscondita terminalis]
MDICNSTATKIHKKLCKEHNQLTTAEQLKQKRAERKQWLLENQQAILSNDLPVRDIAKNFNLTKHQIMSARAQLKQLLNISKQPLAKDWAYAHKNDLLNLQNIELQQKYQLSRIVTKADVGASDGSLTIYRLTVEDPTTLWKYRRNSRVFMAKSVVDIVQCIFSEWQQRSILFASSLTLDNKCLTKDYDVRPFIMQNNELGWRIHSKDFFPEEGITTLIDEAQLKVSNSSEPIQPQKLRLIDSNDQYQALDRRNIRFHRSSATELTDSITTFIGQRSIQPTAVHIRRWQADALETEEGAGSVQSKHQHSENYDNTSLGLEQAWHFSPAWIQDLNGEDGATKSGNSQIEKFNENLSNYYDSQAKRFIATSTVRDAHPWVDVLTLGQVKAMGHGSYREAGEVVVIDFFDGNLDRPFVVGRIHEGHRHPTKFDDKGKLPETKKLSGIKSKEYQGSGYNQLRFDDTTNQISSQLHSSHGVSQLNLGNLSHPKETETSEGRGEGFELRTDQWGAVRAKKGLLLSTFAQDSASGNHLDAAETKSQLESSLNSSKALSEVAKNQQTDPLEMLDGLKQFIEQIEQESETKAKAFKQALMILTSPNSIGLASNEDVHLSADGQIKSRVQATQEGARLFAGKGKLEIQAQGDGADLIARKGVQIISTEDAIYITSPKEIRLIADTSEVKINGSGVFATTGGLFESTRQGQHNFFNGAQNNLHS